MSRIALGTVQFGLSYGIANQDGQVPREMARSMLDAAAAHGVDILDTAIAYGDSEQCLGEIGGRRFRVVTKLPAIPEASDGPGKWIQMQLAQSLQRLGSKSVYGLLLHKPEQLEGVDGPKIFDALQSLKQNGLVEKIGVSIYSPEQLPSLTSKFSFDLVQAPFNLVDRRLQTSGWMEKLKDNGIEIHCRSSFLQGLLLMPYASIPPQFSAWDSLWRKWHAWLENEDVSALDACLAFCLQHPEIDRAVVGADSLNQLNQILEYDSFRENKTDIMAFPDIHSDAENLINPARWSLL